MRPGRPGCFGPRTEIYSVQSSECVHCPAGRPEGKRPPRIFTLLPLFLGHIFPVAIIEHMFYNWDENADREGSAVERRSKVYVKVTADFLPDKTILPRQIVWEDGRVYTVDRVRDIRPAASLKVGGAQACGISASSAAGRPISFFWRTAAPGSWRKKERGG